MRAAGSGPVGEVEQHGAVQHDAQILVAPFHDASRRVDGLRAGLCGAEEPGEVGVPVDELLIEVGAVDGAHEGGLGERVLDLSSDFAEPDVLYQRDDVLTEDVSVI